MQQALAVFATITVLIASAGAFAQVETSTVRFGPDNRYEGYLARPAGAGPFPGMVVIHEWWGLNDNIRGEARKLAEAGYVALAVDLFGKVATEPAQAREMVANLDQQAATSEMRAAVDYLRSLPYVKKADVGSIGWCFGGRQSLLLAINDPQLAAAVVYYGQPVTSVTELRQIKASILGIFGEADESIPVAEVRKFQEALDLAGVSHQIYTYAGAPHAFANPSGGERYKPKAATDAWEKTLAFLDSHLKR